MPEPPFGMGELPALIALPPAPSPVFAPPFTLPVTAPPVARVTDEPVIEFAVPAPAPPDETLDEPTPDEPPPPPAFVQEFDEPPA